MKILSYKWLCFVIIISCYAIGCGYVPIHLQAQEGEFLRVVAKRGDNIHRLLKRYQLIDNECDVDFFYAKNKLKKGDYLLADKSYYLPVYVFFYDSISIRSTIGVKDWEIAEHIQTYNEALHKAKIRLKDYRKDGVLWVPFHALNCVIEEPKKRPKRVFPIFGEQHQNVPLKSKKLKNQVYYIVGGHGGPDPGAIGKDKTHSLCEDEYAYDVALRLTRNLLEHGAVAYMITRDPNDGIRSEQYLACDKDEYCWPNQRIFDNQVYRLRQRANAINELYNKNKAKGVTHQRVVTIHIDSRGANQRADLFFYHYPQNKKGKKLAQILHKTIKKKYDKYQKGRGYTGTIKGRNLHMLRETKPTGVYIELGNIRNKADQKRFILESNRQYLADWLFEGLVKESGR